MKDLRERYTMRKKNRGRPRLNYEDKIERVLPGGNIKSTRYRGKCMKGLMSIQEAKEICIISAYPARDMAL